MEWFAKCGFARRAGRLFVFAAMAAASFCAFGGETWYVSKSGSADNDGKSWETARAGIWDTYFNAAQPGDTILLGAGTWTFTMTWDFNRGITIKGFGDHETIFSGDDKECPVKMNHKDFVLENVVIEHGAIDGADASKWMYPAAGVEFVAGTLKNCIVRHCHPLKDGCNASAVHFNGADSGTTMLMTGCAIVSNHLGTSQAAYGAVDVKAGRLTVIDNCEIAYNTGRAAVGLFLECAAAVKNCVIHDNVGLPVAQLDEGVTGGKGGAARVEDGIMQNCIITNNSCAGAGGGVWLRGGTLENCLIADNHAGGDAGGVWVDNGTTSVIRFCNIGGNTSGTGLGVGLGCASGTGVTCLNDIIWGNGDDPSKEVSGGTYSYCYLPASVSGTGNIVGAADPYQDAANGDYLTVRSADFAGVDKAQDISGVTKDLKGTARPLDGNGDGTAKSDIGCVEFNPSATDAAAYLTTPLDEVTKGDVVTFTLRLDGFGAGTKVVWNYGDGSAPEETGPVASKTHVFAASGSNTVQVIVTDAADHRAEAQAQTICVLPNEVFVSAAGGNVWPYDTPEKAAVSFWTASKYVRAPTGEKGYVTFLPGAYEMDGTIELPAEWVVRGSGHRATTLVQTNRSGIPIVKVVDSSSVVTNLVLYGGYSTGTTSEVVTVPSGAHLTAGLIVDCEISGCTVAAGGLAGNALALEGAGDNCPEARNCLITGNNCFIGPAADGTYPRGAAVYLKGKARLVGCEVSYNTGRGGVVVPTGTSKQDDIIIENCNIHHNTSDSTGAGVLLGGGAMRNCRVCDNVSTNSTGGGIRTLWDDALIVNCLILRNRSLGAGGGCYISNGRVTLLNCTVADNVSDTGAGGIYLNEDKTSSSTVCNTIVWGNRGEGSEIRQENGKILFCCLSAALDDAAFKGNADNVVADPMFVSTAAGDYRLLGGSPCIDAASADAVDAAKALADDVDGTERPLDGDNDGVAKPDMGCYEMPYSETAPVYGRVSASEMQVASGTAVDFAVTLVGVEGTPETRYVWDFGDGTVATDVGVATARHAYRLGGAYAVTVSVQDEDAGLDLESEPLAITVFSKTTYVAPEGEGVYPYDSPERATSDWAAALVAAQGTSPLEPLEPVELRLVAGVHRIGSRHLRGKLTVSGAGVGKTVVDVGTGAGFVLNGADVVLRDLTVSNFNHTAIVVTNGTVAGCEVTCGWPRTATDEVHGIWLAGAHNGTDRICLATNCVVTSVMATNVVATMPATANGAGVRIDKGGWLVDSTVRGCRCDFGPDAKREGADGGIGYGGGLSVSGSGAPQIVRCTFEDNYARFCGGGVYLLYGGSAFSASIVNCRIMDNACSVYAGGGLRLDGNPQGEGGSPVVVAGCLIAGNRRADDSVASGSGAGCYASWGRFVNCTIAGNRGGTYGTGIIFANRADNELVNSIVWGNETWTNRKNDDNRGAELVMEADASVAHLIVGEGRAEIGGTPEDVWHDDPQFKASGYRLKPRSPARGRGDAELWREAWEDPKDFHGRKRFASADAATLDLGAFVCPASGFAFIVK